MFGPAGIPDAALSRLRAELRRVLENPDIKQKMNAAGGLDPYLTTPEEFAALIRRDYEVRNRGQGRRRKAGLDLRALERLGREQLFDLEAAPGDALLVAVLQESLERGSVWLDPVRPEIVAGERAPLGDVVGIHGTGTCESPSSATRAMLRFFAASNAL